LNQFYKRYYRMSCRIVLSIMLFILGALQVKAQSITAGGQSYMSIGDTSILVNGVTFVNNMRIQFSGANNSVPNWKLTVQPLTAYFTAQQSSAGDVAQFGYGPNWPIQYFSIKLNPGASQNSWSNPNSVNAIGAVSTIVPLSSSEITLVEKSDYKIIASDYFALSYDIILNGSRQLLTLHRDNYVVVMRFRLYSNSGALISQMDYSHQIGLWPGWLHLPQSATPAISNGILLQNGGNNVTLNFGTNTAFATGVESVLSNSLQVSSSDGQYQVKVQTLSNYFTNAGATSTVPVSKVQLTATPTSSSVVSTYNPVNLSTTSNTLITNNGSAEIVNNYNLKYSTKQNSNQNAFMNIAAGNYETQITFIMNPL
jgi:hypothetical protein